MNRIVIMITISASRDSLYAIFVCFCFFFNPENVSFNFAFAFSYIGKKQDVMLLVAKFQEFKIPYQSFFHKVIHFLPSGLRNLPNLATICTALSTLINALMR